ncbi:histidine phosphatase family protein [Novosphingobium soli]|uniref:Histidine phosphatase family protein n=1 Tax=Novosphingobium soli TaxID=574956 RepID=A0ABV6CZM4_9SPHN
MGLIHLVRHGTHDEVGRVLSGRSEIALNAAGQEESRKVVRLLGDEEIGAIHSSPRRRARDTAAPLAQARGLPVLTTPALDEIDFGHFTGRSFAELDRDACWHRWNAERSTARCPDGETMAQAIARAVDGLATLEADASPAVCFTHCDVIRGVVAHVLGLPFDRIFRFDCDPGSITTLAVEAGAMRLVALNRRGPRPGSG